MFPILDPLWPVSRSRKLASARGALPTETHVWPGEGHIVQSPANVGALLDSLVAFVARCTSDRSDVVH